MLLPESYWKWFEVPHSDVPKPYAHRLVSEFLPDNIEYELICQEQDNFSFWYVGDCVRSFMVRTDGKGGKPLWWAIFDKDKNLVHKEVLEDES